MNLNIVSAKKDFGNTAFRKTKTGRIETMKNPVYVGDDVSIVHNEYGTDYSEENCCRVKLKFCLMEGNGVGKCLVRLSTPICGFVCDLLEFKLSKSENGNKAKNKTDKYRSRFNSRGAVLMSTPNCEKTFLPPEPLLPFLFGTSFAAK